MHYGQGVCSVGEGRGGEGRGGEGRGGEGRGGDGTGGIQEWSRREIRREHGKIKPVIKKILHTKANRLALIPQQVFA